VQLAPFGFFSDLSLRGHVDELTPRGVPRRQGLDEFQLVSGAGRPVAMKRGARHECSAGVLVEC